MNNKNYQDMIEDTYNPETMRDVLFCMVGVAGEAGEIANMCQKVMRGDYDAEQLARPRTHADRVRREKLLDEMGGVFYFLHALCWQLNVKPEVVLQMNAETLMSRKERGTIRGDGDDR